MMKLHVHLTTGTVITLDADSAEVNTYGDGRIRHFSYTTLAGRYELFYLPPQLIAAVVAEREPTARQQPFTFQGVVQYPPAQN